jgi:putative cell wall-binding protein
VVVVGGNAAVDTTVVSALDSQKVHTCHGSELAPTLEVRRIEGVSRYDTAAKIAGDQGADDIGTIDPSGSCGTPEKTAILVSGENANYPDALSAGPLAFQGSVDGGTCGDHKPLPILLTTKTKLAPETGTALDALDIDRVIVLGGTAAVTDAVTSEVTAKGIGVTRYAGDNRQETATKFADFLLDRGFDGPAFIARGDQFPDALAGGSVAGTEKGVILLSSSSSSLGTVTSTYLKNTDSIDEAVLLGGTTALTGAVQTSAGAAFTGRN